MEVKFLRTIFLVALEIMRIVVAHRGSARNWVWLVDGRAQTRKIELLADEGAVIRQVLLRRRQTLFQGSNTLCRISLLHIRVGPVVWLNLCEFSSMQR